MMMKDRKNFREPVLPPELARLDAELSSLRYEERPSFGPELEAELAREWMSLRGRRYWPVRQLLAAGLACLILTGFGVPSARAAIVRFVGSFQATPQPEASPTIQAPAALELFLETPDEARDESVVGVPPAGSSGPELGSGFVAPYVGPEATFPELRDRPAVEALVRRNYPLTFQRAGIGGVVRLLLWVDTTGAVDFVNLGHSSGIPELDRAALQVAPSFRFDPARRRGKSVGTWVEFDVRFEPAPPEGDDALPVPNPVDEPSALEVLEVQDFLISLISPEWAAALPASGSGSTEDALRAALGEDEATLRLGSAARILQGEPPVGVAPTQWRADVCAALEAALARSPDNLAPFLALARIRQKQGLRTEGRILLDRGLQRAQRSPGSVPAAVLADLQYERGLMVREAWVASRGLGRLPSEALPAGSCPQARSSGSASGGFASMDRLIAWNYLCPEVLGEILADRFELQNHQALADRAVALGSFRSATEALPAHQGANLEVLLALADENRWTDLLGSATNFVRASGGDPYGLLLSGIALQRLSRSEEADAVFRRAMEVLPESEVSQLEDLTPILVEPQASEYRAKSREQRQLWAQGFWSALDPILATPVNEREVEHIARSTYASLRFGSIRSDASEVWIRYGRPDAVRAFGEADGVRMEFWDFGPGPDLTFRRFPFGSRMDLTPEGRSYLDEVSQVVPHRYGNSSRLVFPLPAQVSRFGGQGEVRTDVTLKARVPRLLATGSEDSLALSFVLLGPGSNPVTSSVRTVSAVEGDVAMQATAAGPITGVVVEFYSPRTGQAAALRRTLRPLAEASGVSMSDIILTAPASPRRQDVSRHSAWMEPLALDQPVALHAIGVFVELYGVPSVSPWYRLRAEIQDRATGDIRDLPIQPAGETGFRATWDRRPAAEGVTKEFVSVWLGDVPSGRYILRLVADVPDAGAPLMAEQELDRR